MHRNIELIYQLLDAISLLKVYADGKQNNATSKQAHATIRAAMELIEEITKENQRLE